MKYNTLPLFALFSLLLFTNAAAKIITIESRDGKLMTVTVNALKGDKVVIKRTKDSKLFTISPDSLSPNSKQQILQEMKLLKDIYPPLEADVSIGKRRSANNGSYYMKKMDISSKVSLFNKDNNIECPPCTVNMIFIGQDQSATSKFRVLSNQQFKLSPTPRGVNHSTKPFLTTYDSGNKGYGNFGGYKYVAYLLVVKDKKNQVIHTKTLYSKIKKAIDQDRDFAKKLAALKTGTTLGENMLPFGK